MMMKCAYFLTGDHAENVNENDDDDGEYLQERLTQPIGHAIDKHTLGKKRGTFWREPL